MSKLSRQELLAVTLPCYKAASRQEKTEILANFVATTGYSRKHATKLLQGVPKVGEFKKRGKPRRLSEEALAGLVVIWRVSNRICSKRLVPFIAETIENLQTNGHLQLSEKAQSELLKVSAATVDRVLKKEREKIPRSLTSTKRACLVKNKVPIRTFTEWKDVVPGFFEIDTVSHSSADPNGPFLSTLNMTDVATCWTLPMAIGRKSSIDVIDALERATKALPFKLLGLDFDNGTEFLNEELIRWCESNSVTYTRSREYKKNDQCFVEEKNRSVVRRNVGRERYVGDKAKRKLVRLYSVLALYINFFQPCQKLLFKKRNGAKSYKKHDVAKTPYARVLENDHIDSDCKAALRRHRERLDMFELFTELQSLILELKELAVDVPDPALAASLAQRIATYKFVTHNPQPPKQNSKPRKGDMAALRATILQSEPGTVLRAKNLPWEASRSSADSCLTRLSAEGLLRRVSWGVYEVESRP